MAQFTSSVAVNGVSSFSLDGLGGPFFWSNGFLRGLDLFGGDPADSYVVDMFQSGSWTIRDLTFVGNAPKTIRMLDQDSNQRYYELIQFFDGASATLDFAGTAAFGIRAFGGAYDYTFGAQRYEVITFNTEQTVALSLAAGGRIGRLTAFTEIGAATRDIAIAGRVDDLRLSNGTDAVTVAEGGRLDRLRIDGDVAGSSPNAVTVEGRVVTMELYDRDNTVTVSGLGTSTSGRIDRLEADGALDLQFLGGARAFLIKLNGATADVSSETGHIESLFLFESTATMRFGAGGLSQMWIGGAGGLQDIQSEGFVGALAVTDDNQLFLTLGAGGAGGIRATAATNHRITTGDGFVGTIQTGDGADVIAIGAGGVNFAHAGRGDDRFLIGAVDVATGARIAGGRDSDTADFRTLGFGVRVDLGEFGFQDLGALSGGVMGPILFDGIENLIGTNHDDVLIGGAEGAILQGLGGADTLQAVAGVSFLYGGAGADRLIAGTGDDRMNGGADVDTFVFAAGTGYNRINGFQRTLDRIEIDDGTPGVADFDDLTVTLLSWGTRIDYADTSIALAGVTGAITAGNFDFV